MTDANQQEPSGKMDDPIQSGSDESVVTAEKTTPEQSKPEEKGADAKTVEPEQKTVAHDSAAAEQKTAPEPKTAEDVPAAEAKAAEAKPEEPKPEEASHLDPCGYEIYHRSETLSEADLYSFRVRPEMAPITTPPELENNVQVVTAAVAPSSSRLVKIVLFAAVAAAGLAFLVALIAPKLQAPPLTSNDLGPGVFAVAGVKGNLVAKWEGKAKYELKLEPIDQRQQEGFAAVAADPPHPITLSVRLKDASNNVVCSKNILFQLASPKADSTLADKSAAPAALPVGTNPPQAAATSPQPPPSLNIDASDSVQSEIGSDGQIAALHAQGDLPCSKQLYQRIYYWDFSTDFPTVAEQEELLKGHKLVAAKAERKEQPADKSSAPTRAGGMKSLPTPIEGDDVITGFSPARGVAETRSGRVFLIGSGGLQDRGTGWQVFPASIHYRCDKKAACIITRNGASATMHARLKQ